MYSEALSVPEKFASWPFCTWKKINSAMNKPMLTAVVKSTGGGTSVGLLSWPIRSTIIFENPIPFTGLQFSLSCHRHFKHHAKPSSRTQGVFSLSACEAELRSMTSCLCDGTYIRRCIQFVTNVQIEHPLLVEYSFARQIAMRLGLGKLKWNT